MNASALSPRVLEIDVPAEIERLCGGVRDCISRTLLRRGAVVAVSGGVDSALCLALAVQALGRERVLALILPERESAPEGSRRARALAGALGLEPLEQDITGVLDALGCYRARDQAVQRAVPDYGPGWRMKIALSGALEGRLNHFRLIAQSPEGLRREARLGYRDYLQIVAATSFKQRVRKTIEYYHADRLNFAVLGTPNRLEFDQGFFVKNGDGSADVKPIAHLYKSQVYALAAHLRVPEEITSAQPTTDTYTLEQGQDEFYFALPLDQMDLALWALDHGVGAAELAQALGTTVRQAQLVYDGIRAKRRAADYLHRRPVVFAHAAHKLGAD